MYGFVLGDFPLTFYTWCVVITIFVIGLAWLIVTAINHVRRMYNVLLESVTSRCDRLEQRAQLIEHYVAAASNGVQNVTDRTCLMFDGWALTSMLLAVIALARGLYTKLKGEKKESKVSEKDVYTAFDTFAILCIIPLVFKSGFVAAFDVWRWIKTIGTVVRDLAGGCHLFSRFFQDKDAEPAFGVGFVDDIAQVADELVNRADEHKQAQNDEEEKYSIDLPVAQPVLINCPICKVDNVPLSAHKHGGAYLHFGQKDGSIFWDGIRKYWDKQEDLVRINSLKKTVEDKPWLLPVVIILIFACILVVIRISRRSCAKEHKERASSNKKKQAKSVASKGKRRHYDASGTDDDADEQGIFYTDEEGNLGRRKERKLKAQIDFEINGPHRKMMTSGREESQVKDESKDEVVLCQIPNCNHKCGNFHKVKSKQKKILKDYKKSKSSSKKKKVQFKTESRRVKGCIHAKDCPMVINGKIETGSRIHCNTVCGGHHCVHFSCCNPSRKESLINGLQFDSSTVAKSVGRAIVQSGTVVSRMCFTFALNGLILCEHIFKDGGDTVTFVHDDKSVEVKRSKSKKIGNDLLWFPRPHEFKDANMLHTTLPIIGSKIQIVAFNSEEDLKLRRFKHDSGVVKVIQNNVGAEKAYATYSSVNGNCSAPVVTPENKVVGFHNATTDSETVFIPITKHMVSVATGSVSTF